MCLGRTGQGGPTIVANPAEFLIHQRFGKIRHQGRGIVRSSPPGLGACTVVGYGVVVSVHRVNGKHLIVELDSVDEAMAFVAEANGETGADVLATARRAVEYLRNARTGKRAPAEGMEKKRVVMDGIVLFNTESCTLMCPGFEYRGQCRHARDVKTALASGVAPPSAYVAVAFPLALARNPRTMILPT